MIAEFAPKNFLDKDDITCKNKKNAKEIVQNKGITIPIQKNDIQSCIKKEIYNNGLADNSFEEISKTEMSIKTSSMSCDDTPKKTKQSPHYNGHRARLRERVLSQIHTAPSYELLELLLGYVHGRKDTKPLSKELLHKFGSLWGVLNAHPAELSDFDNVGPSTKVFFTLIREVIARYFVEPIKAKKSVSISDIVVMARCMMDGLPHEEIWVALLDNSNRLLAFEQVQTGMEESVPCSAKQLAKIAFDKKASALILIHNHPGGKASPSLSDIETTKYLQNVLRHMGIRLLEHLILADGKVSSFLNNHLLTQEETSFFSID